MGVARSSSPRAVRGSALCSSCRRARASRGNRGCCRLTRACLVGADGRTSVHPMGRPPHNRSAHRQAPAHAIRPRCAGVTRYAPKAPWVQRCWSLRLLRLPTICSNQAASDTGANQIQAARNPAPCDDTVDRKLCHVRAASSAPTRAPQSSSKTRQARQ